MKTKRYGYRNPVATGLALFFAITAAVLLLVRVTIDGGVQAEALVETLVLAALVIGLASIGVLAGAGRNAMPLDRSGLPARA